MRGAKAIRTQKYFISKYSSNVGNHLFITFLKTIMINVIGSIKNTAIILIRTESNPKKTVLFICLT